MFFVTPFLRLGDSVTTRAEEFRLIYEAHYGDVLGYAVRRTASRDDAEDIAAETFQVAWRRLDDLPGGTDTRLWLFGAARRVLANHHRGRHRARGLLDRVKRVTLPSRHRPDPADAIGEADRLTRALDSLQESDREVLRLQAWEGLSAPEVAAVLGVSTAAVWKRLERARERLKGALEQIDAEEEAPVSRRLGDVPVI
jgi:RNA polymerase sigma-70 factor (ECF subfamily)